MATVFSVTKPAPEGAEALQSQPGRLCAGGVCLQEAGLDLQRSLYDAVPAYVRGALALPLTR